METREYVSYFYCVATVSFNRYELPLVPVKRPGALLVYACTRCELLSPSEWRMINLQVPTAYIKAGADREATPFDSVILELTWTGTRKRGQLIDQCSACRPPLLIPPSPVSAATNFTNHKLCVDTI